MVMACINKAAGFYRPVRGGPSDSILLVPEGYLILMLVNRAGNDY